jgi:valyl-tRNA synthetase
VVQAVIGETTLMLPLADVIDLGAERARLVKARGVAAQEISKIEKKFANADFMAKAKEEVIEENRERLETFSAEIARLDAALSRIAG